MSRKPKATAVPRAVSSKPAPKPVVKMEDTHVEPLAMAAEAVVEVPVIAEEPVVVEAPVAIVAVEPEPVVEAAVAVEAVAETIPEAEEPVPAPVVEMAPAEPAKTPSKPSPSQGIKTMIKSTEEIVAFNQANVEAFVKSGQIWATGVQELTKQFASTAKASFDESVASFKALTSVKSVKEAVELQTSFAKTVFEKAVAESNKLTDASIKLTEQTLAPITARVTVAVETFGKAA
jgi:phasin family protein